MSATATGPIDWVAHLEGTLEHFDDVGGHRYLSRAFEDLSVEQALVDVVMPYLRGLGERWENGSIGVGQEHFASHVIRSRLSAAMQREGRAKGPLAVFACLPKEQHEFGLMASALALARLGWRTCYLGTNTPAAELVRTCGRLNPDAVVLSAHRQTAFAAHAPVLRHLAASTSVYIGARGATGALGELCHATHLDGDPVAGARRIHQTLSACAATKEAG